MSLQSSMNIAQQALMINQAALNVVSNNIANINTDGYSKQSVILSPSVNYTPLGGSVLSQIMSATGVQMDGIKRYTDEYLQSYYREQNSQYNYLNQLSNAASSVENAMNELNGTGLEDALTSFYSAAQTLNSNPKDSVARSNYAQQAQTVALKFNEMYNTLKQSRTSLVGDPTDVSTLATAKISTSATEVNQKLAQLAQINSQVVSVSSADMSPNNLLDVRDQLINDLSGLIPVTVTSNSNGSVNISLNGVELVKGTELQGQLMVNSGDASNPAIIDVVDKDNKVIAADINDKINTGTMGAILAAGGSSTSVFTVKSAMDNLDKLASGFAGIINDIQTKAGTTVGTVTPTPMYIDKTTMTLKATTAADVIFNTKDGSATVNASNIQINSSIMSDPYKIATARVSFDTAAIPPYDSSAVGDAKNSQMILDSRKGTYATLNNSSPEGYLSAIVGDIGIKVDNIATNLKNQNTVLTQVKTQLSSATGVSQDEELVDLIKYQRAYQASARVFSTCNDLMDILVNLGK